MMPALPPCYNDLYGGRYGSAEMVPGDPANLIWPGGSMCALIDDRGL